MWLLKTALFPFHSIFFCDISYRMNQNLSPDHTYSAVHGVMDTSKSMDGGMENNAIGVPCVGMSLFVLHPRNFLCPFKTFVRFVIPQHEEQTKQHSVHACTSLGKHGQVGVHGFLPPHHLPKTLLACFLRHVLFLGHRGSMDMMANGWDALPSSSFIGM